MEEDFLAAYKQLNAEQRQAVDSIEGPVLVVAGPGTGKTQLLSLRVANILRQTDADPSAILCLTFTNFAAANMRERLRRLIGSGAQNVRVQTFHSFAADIMALYPDYFWHGARLKIAPDTVQLDIVQSILAELPLDNPLASKFTGQFTALPDVQQALKLSKEAGLTPAKLAAMIDVNTAYLDVIEPDLIDILSPALSVKKLPELLHAVSALPDQPIDAEITPLRSLSTVMKESLAAAIRADEQTGKTTATGKWKRRWLQTVNGRKGLFDERRRNAWWRAFAAVYESYRQRLHEHGYYDYSDMIVEVISQLEHSPELRASVQERFLYTLIDEFQDTNAAQLRLAHLVATHEADQSAPNLMAVGDDDQSIFAFNGAELNNMLAFRSTYPATNLVVLTKNYRSTQAILDTAQAIIEQASDRVVTREPDLSKHLEATQVLSPGEISHTRYPTRAHQYTAVTRRIAQLQQAEAAGKIAVLARSHASLRELSSLLNKLQVPIRYEQQNNILQEEIVMQVYLLADTIIAIGEGAAATVNANLAQLLRHPMWRVPTHTLWQLAMANYREPDWLSTLIEHEDEHLAAIGFWLEWLAGEAVHQPLPVLVEYLVGLRAGEHLTSPLRQYYLDMRSVDNSYLQSLSGMNVLLELVREFAASEQPTLADFVSFVQLNNELGRGVVDQSWFVSGAQAVQLMTVHKAKGLEFDTVFLLDANEDAWKPRSFGRKPPANLPLQAYGEQYDDYVRLLFVAATRAKRSFIVSSFRQDMQGNDLLPTPLLTDAIIAAPAQESSLPEPIQVLETALSWPRLDRSEERALLQERLDNYALSATGLCQFLDVANGGPANFFASSLLRVPGSLTPQLAYGNALHSAMQTAQLLTNQNLFTLTEVQAAYEHALSRQVIPLHDKNRYLPFGKQVLAKLFNELGFSLPAGGRAEYGIGPLGIGNARLRGTLDHLHDDNGALLITDYKTGTPVTSFQTHDKTKLTKVWRHRLQLTFYALLARQALNPKTITTRMAYVEAETATQLLLSYAPEAEDIDKLKRLIAAVWQHIMELNFPDTSGYSHDAAGIARFSEDLISGSI